MICSEQLKINANEEQGCFIEILEKIKEQMDAMLSHHSRILVIRFDLHTCTNSTNSHLLSNFIRKIRKKLKSHYRLTRVGYVWVREIEKAKSQHYHLVLFLDANKVRFPNMVLGLIEDIWLGWEQSKPYTPKRCYYTVDRKTLANYEDAFYRLSYLAKERGKGYKASTANDYSTSRIKSKELDGSV